MLLFARAARRATSRYFADLRLPQCGATVVGATGAGKLDRGGRRYRKA